MRTRRAKGQVLTPRQRWQKHRDYYQPILRELERQRNDGGEDPELENDIRDLQAHMQTLLPVGADTQPRELKPKQKHKQPGRRAGQHIGQHKRRAGTKERGC